MSRSLVALLLLVALAGAGCGNTTTTAPSTAASPTPASQASAAPASAAPASGAPSAAASRHADPTLEALLPELLGGASLVRESQHGTDLTSQSTVLDAMLKDLGKTLADFTVASAYSSAGEVKAQVGAWRIAGAATDKILPEFQLAVQASSATTLAITKATIGGHDVTQIGAAGQLAQGPLYAFVRDDMVLFVQTTDPKLAEEALAAIK